LSGDCHEAQNMKRLPIGIQTFRDIIQNDYLKIGSGHGNNLISRINELKKAADLGQ
jgi:hypothetical protein